MQAVTTPPDNPALASEADKERPGGNTPWRTLARSESRSAGKSNSYVEKQGLPLARYRLF